MSQTELIFIGAAIFVVVGILFAVWLVLPKKVKLRKAIRRYHHAPHDAWYLESYFEWNRVCVCEDCGVVQSRYDISSDFCLNCGSSDLITVVGKWVEGEEERYWQIRQDHRAKVQAIHDKLDGGREELSPQLRNRF